MAKISKDTVRVSTKFKNRLNYLLDSEDLDIPSFCAQANISQSPIRNASNFGIIPSVLVLIKIADFFNLSFEYLICKTEENNFIESLTHPTFFERYELLKTERKLTHSKIASFMPFGRNVISEWKRNNTIPSLDNLTALAEFFNVCVDFLLGRTDYRK